MPEEAQESSNDSNYVYFDALSHPTRVRILTLVGEKELSFSSLKHELGIGSSGHLQHHLQKLSDFVMIESNGNYALTDKGRRALEIYGESERSGRSLQDLCYIPVSAGLAHNNQISRNGTIVRLSIGSVLLAATAAIIVSSLVSGLAPLTVYFGNNSASLGADGILFFGFFGVSFLISAFSGYPGCEITAIPNLFVSKKWYCGCLMPQFNLPNGGMLKHGTSEAKYPRGKET
ncbi:MAG: winged helix-turn-helix domain-containing protein [Nitrososphaerales archaeon]